MTGSLTTGTEELKEAVRRFFVETYHNPAMKFSAQVDPKLAYAPTMQFKIHSHLTVLVEVSENPYPAILSMRRIDMEDLQFPIAVYCACPEEAYLANQSDAKRLIEHGFGLVTVSSAGDVQRRAGCIPLIQRISSKEFQNELLGLPPALKRKLSEAFEKYVSSAPAGAADIAEVLEGLILKAGREAAERNWIARSAARSATATTLDAMQNSPQLGSAMAAIGSVRGYISQYRNTNHHFPKNREQAARKYKECRHAFIDGLKRVCQFRSSMKSLGLSGNLPS